jgi:hypothetical protein
MHSSDYMRTDNLYGQIKLFYILRILKNLKIKTVVTTNNHPADPLEPTNVPPSDPVASTNIPQVIQRNLQETHYLKAVFH